MKATNQVRHELRGCDPRKNGRGGERKARRLSHPQAHALSTAMKERSTITVQPQVAGYGEGVR
eukprot:3197499-Rhodomonas_salina.3